MNLPHLQPMLDQELREAAERVLKRRGEPMPWRYTTTSPVKVPEHALEYRVVYLESDITTVTEVLYGKVGVRTLLAVESAYWMRDPPTIIVTECG